MRLATAHRCRSGRDAPPSASRKAQTSTHSGYDILVDICGTAVLTLDLQVHECEEVDLHARLSLVRTNSAAEQVSDPQLGCPSWLRFSFSTMHRD
jgi:hypothetical protein